jgi:DedD protein
MAFFKFRQSDSPSTSNRPTESIEVMRQRAKHRLIGSAVLVLAGVVGFPLLFDTQPRPMPVDVQIDIPDKNKVALLPAPLPAPTTGPTERAHVAAASSLDAKEQLVAPDVPKNKVKPLASNEDIAIKDDETGADDTPAPAVVPKTPPKPEPKVERKVEKVEKTDKKADESARAKALLDGKDVPVKPHDDDGSRYIIQVGAFAETVRMKLERAGLKTYTHVAETPEGPRTRVRLGPFTSKADADKAAAKVKALALPAALLTL